MLLAGISNCDIASIFGRSVATAVKMIAAAAYNSECSSEAAAALFIPVGTKQMVLKWHDGATLLAERSGA